MREKLRWVFHFYDTNGDGLISLSDLKEVLCAIYRMLGKYTFPPHDEQSPTEHAQLIFEVHFIVSYAIITHGPNVRDVTTGLSAAHMVA